MSKAETCGHAADRKYKHYNSLACRECDKTWAREYRKRHPEIIAKHARKRNFGLEHGVFLKMVAGQNGVCKICGNPPVRAHLDVDHDHETWKIRGLLCNSCNGGLGLFRDNLDLLRLAVKYLEEA